MRYSVGRLFAQIINSPIVAGLVGAAFGLVLASLADEKKNQLGPPRWALVGLFIAAVLSAVFVYNRLSTIEKTLGGLQNATDLVRLDAQSGAMSIVVGLTQNASVIRVVGRARQDQLSSLDSPQFDYLKATEAAVKTGGLNVYRRITGRALREPFRNHLSRLLDDHRAGRMVEIALVSDIDALVSYQVFDTTAAIIGIETAPVPGIRDSTVVFLTHRSELIEALIAHFDAAWTGLSPTSVKVDFESQTSML